MPDYRNPADRLLQVTRTLKAVPSNLRIRDAIETAFAVRGDRAVLRVAVDLIDLPDIAANALSREANAASLAEDRKEYYVKWREHYTTAFAQMWSFESALAGVVQFITEDDVTALQGAAYWLEDRSPSHSLNDSELDKLAADATALSEAIVQSTQLPDELKHALIDQLDKIVRALRHARIAGPAVLAEASDETLGAIVRDLGHRASSSEEGSNILRRILAFLNAVNLLVSVTTGVTALPSHLGTVFGLTDGGGPAIEG